MDIPRIVEMASTPEAMRKTVLYLAEHMRAFLKKGERVMICFDDHPASLGWLFKRAVLECGAVPVVWDQDHRWKTLLRQAFSSKAHTIIGPPLVILGLTKIARVNETPLYIRNAVTAGYPCVDWVRDGLMAGLDCRTWACFDWNETSIVAGFSCTGGRGVHLRDDEYGVKIVDKQGKELPAGTLGEILLYHRSAPDELYSTRDCGRIQDAFCSCGSASTRLVDIIPDPEESGQLFQIEQEIIQWTSVLDCRMKKGPGGLEIEIVVFPGEKLPKLPSCAKLVVRPWDPEMDKPFWIRAEWKNPAVSH